ncbi:MAG: hypothetical protein QM648_07350 [Solirubrobacterales bacterium]
MASSPKKAYNELAEALGAAPPTEFNDLTADELGTLTRLFGESLELHEASIASAEDDVIKLAPRPLRGTVRKMLGA